MSADYANDSRSSIVDGPTTMVTDDTLLKVYAWYDNEVGYACRMVDLANIVIERGARWRSQLPDRHGFVLGLHAGRRRAAHARTVPFLSAWIYPFTLAFLFLLYETAGIAANLGGGWLASRFGIPRMLAVGQILQIAGLLMLSGLNPDWAAPRPLPGSLSRRVSPASPRISRRPLRSRRSRRPPPRATVSCSAGWRGSPDRRMR